MKQKQAMTLGSEQCQITKEQILEWFKEVEMNLANEGLDITGFPPDRFVLMTSGHKLIF